MPSSTLTSHVFFFWTGMWKFPDQGWKPCHSSNLNHSSNNTGSLTLWATRELHSPLPLLPRLPWPFPPLIFHQFYIQHRSRYLVASSGVYCFLSSGCPRLRCLALWHQGRDLKSISASSTPTWFYWFSSALTLSMPLLLQPHAYCSLPSSVCVLASAIAYCAVSFACFIGTLAKARVGAPSHFLTESLLGHNFHTSPHRDHTSPSFHLFSFHLAEARMPGSRCKEPFRQGWGCRKYWVLLKDKVSQTTSTSPTPSISLWYGQKMCIEIHILKSNFFFYFITILLSIDNSRPTSITGQVKCLCIFLRMLNLSISQAYYFCHSFLKLESLTHSKL